MPPPRGYTHGGRGDRPGRTVYIAGQLGMTPEGAFAGGPGDFRAQATQCFENLKAALASVGAGFKHVVKITNFFIDMAHLPSVLRGARQIREHQGAAGLDRDPDRPARARRRAVRDRGDGGDAGPRGEGRRSKRGTAVKRASRRRRQTHVSDAFTRIAHIARMPSFVYVLGCRAQGPQPDLCRLDHRHRRAGSPSTTAATARAPPAAASGCCCTPRNSAPAGRR